MTTTNSAPPAATGVGAARVPVKLRIHPDTKVQTEYWAAKHGGMSSNEYMVLAVEEKIARENGDYDLPALEVQRLHQILDAMAALTTSHTNLQAIVTGGFSSLLGLARGDSYLLDDEDGELPISGTPRGLVFTGGDVPTQGPDDAAGGES